MYFQNKERLKLSKQFKKETSKRAIFHLCLFLRAIQKYSLPCPRGRAPWFINVHGPSLLEHRNSDWTKNWPNGNQDNNKSTVHTDGHLWFVKFFKCNMIFINHYLCVEKVIFWENLGLLVYVTDWSIHSLNNNKKM